MCLHLAGYKQEHKLLNFKQTFTHKNSFATSEFLERSLIELLINKNKLVHFNR